MTPHTHSHMIAGKLLTPGTIVKYTTNGGSSHTVYVAKTPIRDLGFGRGVYKTLNVWNNSRIGRCVYDRQTVII